MLIFRKIFLKKITDSGFTLVETMVAVSVLLIALSSVMTLSSYGLSSIIGAKDQVIATYLSQEAIEFVRNKRDQNSLELSNWLSGLAICIDAKCTIDSPNNTIRVCPGGVCDRLRYDPTTYLYGYETTGGWSDSIETKFIREITIENVWDNEIIMTVTMYWRDRNLLRSFSIKESLLNWE